MRKLFLFLFFFILIIFNLSAFAKVEIDPKAIEKLIADLKSEERVVRDNATLELIKIGVSAVPELIKELANPNSQVQEFVAGILGNIEDKSAVPALLSALEKKPSRRYSIAWALGKIKDERAIEPLLETLKDEQPSVRETAFRALIMIGAKATPHILKRIKDNDPKMRSYGIALLAEVGGVNSEGEVIGTLTDEDSSVRETACKTLGAIGTEKSVEPLIKVVEAEASWRVRINAINSLGILGDARPVPALEKTIKDERFIVREWSARALENITGKRYQYLNEDNELVYPYNLYH